MRVLIVGAGIAGLTTALALHAVGIEAQIVDSATARFSLPTRISSACSRSSADFLVHSTTSGADLTSSRPG